MKTMRQLPAYPLALFLTVLVISGCSRASKVQNKVTSAQEYFRNSDYAAAEIEFKNLLALEPGHPEALKGLGLIWVAQGAMFEGGRMLSAAKTKLPTDDDVCFNLASTLFGLGFIGDSRQELLELLDRSPVHGDAMMLLAESSFNPDTMKQCEERITRAGAKEDPSVLLASALIELRRGRLDEGEDTVKNVLAIKPDFARALALQATIHRVRKEPEKALAPQKKAADLAGARSSELGTYAKLLMELGRKDEAVALLKDATRKAPDYLPNWKILGQISFAAGNDPETEEYLSKVLAKSPLDIDAALVISQAWIRQRKSTKAVELLENVAKTFTSRPRVDLALGKAYLATGDSLKAAAAFDRIIAMVPDEAESLILRSGIHLKDGQPTEAIRNIEPILTSQPANRMAQDLLVQAYIAAKRPDEAIALLKRQTAAYPAEPGPHLRLGQALQSQGKSSEARTAYERVLEITPNDPGAVSLLVVLDFQQGNSDAAMARADAYLASNPQSAHALLLKASLSYARKDYKSAEQLANRTIELKPDEIAAYGIIVRILTQEGRSEEAILRLKELLKTSPDNIAARMNLGALLQALGRRDEARANFEEMVKIRPNFAPAYNNLAYLESEVSGDLERAAEHARKARELAPDQPAISDTLGWIEWLRGHYREALQPLREAAAAMPANASVQYHFALAAYMMYQVSDSIAGLEKALATDGPFPEKTEALRRLSILRDGGGLNLEALEPLEKSDPKDPVIKLLLAAKLDAAGRPADALIAYQNALAINPDLEAAHLGKAKLYSSVLNQPDKAFESANLARKAAPQSPQAAAVLGAAHFRMGRHEQAYELLREALRKLPDDAEVLYHYAWAAYSMGDVDEARLSMAKLAKTTSPQTIDAKTFLGLTNPTSSVDPALPALMETILAKTPHFVPALMARAGLAEKSGERPVETYRKIIGIYPKFSPACIALARLYLDDTNQLEEAERLANEARGRLENDEELVSILAMLNYHKGEFDYAAQLFKELSAKRALTGRELFVMGMSLAATHQNEEARRSISDAIRIGLTEQDAIRAKAALADLDNPDTER